MKREELRKILRGKCITDEACEAAIDELLKLHIASDFLIKPKISLTNSLRAMLRQNPDMCESGYFYKYKKAMQYGYDLAVRRLKKSVLPTITHCCGAIPYYSLSDSAKIKR